MTEKIDSVIQLILSRTQANVKLFLARFRPIWRPVIQREPGKPHGLSFQPETSPAKEHQPATQPSACPQTGLPGSLPPLKNRGEKSAGKNRSKDTGKQPENGKPRNDVPGFFYGLTDRLDPIPLTDERHGPIPRQGSTTSSHPISRSRSSPPSTA